MASNGNQCEESVSSSDHDKLSSCTLVLQETGALSGSALLNSNTVSLSSGAVDNASSSQHLNPSLSSLSSSEVNSIDTNDENKPSSQISTQNTGASGDVAMATVSSESTVSLSDDEENEAATPDAVLADIGNAPVANVPPPVAPVHVPNCIDALDYCTSPMSGLGTPNWSAASAVYGYVRSHPSAPKDFTPLARATHVPAASEPFLQGSTVQSMRAVSKPSIGTRDTSHPFFRRQFCSPHIPLADQAALRSGLLTTNIDVSVPFSKWTAPRNYHQLQFASLADEPESVANTVGKPNSLYEKIKQRTVISSNEARASDEVEVGVFEDLQEYKNEGGELKGEVVASISGRPDAIDAIRVTGVDKDTPSMVLDLVRGDRGFTCMPELVLARTASFWTPLQRMMARRTAPNRQFRGIMNIMDTGIPNTSLDMTLEELTTEEQREALRARFNYDIRHRADLAQNHCLVINNELTFPGPLRVPGSRLILDGHNDLRTISLDTDRDRDDAFVEGFCTQLLAHMNKTNQECMETLRLNGSFRMLTSFAQPLLHNPNSVAVLDCKLFDWSEIEQHLEEYAPLLQAVGQLPNLRVLKILSRFYIFDAEAIEAIMESLVQLTSLETLHFNAIRFHGYAVRQIFLGNVRLEDIFIRMGHSPLNPPIEAELNANFQNNPAGNQQHLAFDEQPEADDQEMDGSDVSFVADSLASDSIGDTQTNTNNQIDDQELPEGLDDHPTAQTVVWNGLEDHDVLLNIRRAKFTLNAHFASRFVSRMPVLEKLVLLANSGHSIIDFLHDLVLVLSNAHRTKKDLTLRIVYVNDNYDPILLLADRIRLGCLDIGFRTEEGDGFFNQVFKEKGGWLQIKFYIESGGAMIKAKVCDLFRESQQYRFSAENDDSDISDMEDELMQVDGIVDIPMPVIQAAENGALDNDDEEFLAPHAELDEDVFQAWVNNDPVIVTMDGAMEAMDEAFVPPADNEVEIETAVDSGEDGMDVDAGPGNGV